MLRTQIFLTEEDRRLLDAATARTGRSISALIRVAVQAVYGDSRSESEDVQFLRESFGAWQDRELDGAVYVEGLRSGGRLPQPPGSPGR